MGEASPDRPGCFLVAIFAGAAVVGNLLGGSVGVRVDAAVPQHSFAVLLRLIAAYWAISVALRC